MTTHDVRRLILRQIVSRAVQAFVLLGLPDTMRDAGHPVDRLARSADADADSLRRLLRALVAFGVVDETAHDTFALGPLGHQLRSDTPGTAGPTALLAADAVGRAWDGMARAVRSGRPVFEEVAGAPFFPYLSGDQRLRSVFDASQAAGLRAEVPGILAALGPERPEVVVDVGGGDGALLERVLSHHPGARGVLFERPESREPALARMARAGLADRFAFRAGDFLADELPAGDLVLLRHIVHDHGDDDAATVLRACGRALGAGGRLAVIEMAAPETGARGEQSWDAAVMDLYMMCLFAAGRERGARELAALLDRCGFDVAERLPLPGGAVLTLGRPRGADPPGAVDELVDAWFRAYLMRDHAELGRTGPVCPFVESARRAGAIAVERDDEAEGEDPAALRALVLTRSRGSAAGRGTTGTRRCGRSSWRSPGSAARAATCWTACRRS
ncbi:methyltransferase [Streptomyces sp. PT12]|uniref:methyltransferase n=1 Tax=Streptomyces sp. PT12 TaxID=1510197 RepID=UPI000DE412FA|nr:methyltransferase [Streptomyces sp. PT12]RBM23934.1 methyltransferase [Streptomyces sp. PT12]